MPRKPPPSIEEPKTAPASSETGRQRIQMTDIARLAGVSSATVSRALSASPLIPEQTRLRITELANSLGYRVNVAAANLRKRDVQTIGVVILGDSMQMISDPFLLSILGAVADTLDESGWSMLLTRLKDNRRHVLSDLVNSGQVAGLIVIGQLTLHDYLNELTRNGFPMVVWGAPLTDSLYSVVGSDNAMGGYLATQHLLAQGCRRIAFFGDHTHPEAGQRYAGYTRALREAGIEPDPQLLQSFLFGDVRIRQVIDQWLNQRLSFDAIFATSDVTAISLMGALKERGISVPSQVRLVGYDGIALAEHMHPTLTTIRQPVDQAGRALVELLLETLQGHPSRSIVLPTSLIERESTQ